MKKGKRDGRGNPFVQMFHEQIDSAAFRSLSTDAVWLLIQMTRSWHKKGGWICYAVPRGQVRFRLSDRAYSKAIGELLRLGFLDVGSGEGGLLRTMKRYRPSERWKAVSADLLKDQDAGSFVRQWNLNGSMDKVWAPMPKRSIPRGLQEYHDRQRAQKSLLKLRERRFRQKDLKNSKGKKAKS